MGPSYTAPMAYSMPAYSTPAPVVEYFAPTTYAAPAPTTSYMEVPVGPPVWVPDTNLTSAPSMLTYPTTGPSYAPTTPATHPTGPTTHPATGPTAKPTGPTHKPAPRPTKKKSSK